MTAVALIAAVLIWALLYVDALTKQANAVPNVSPPSAQTSIPDAQAPAPVTTSTS
jgi:hypothetical protein